MRYPSVLTIAKPRVVRFTLRGSAGLFILAKHYDATQSDVMEVLVTRELIRLKLVPSDDAAETVTDEQASPNSNDHD